MVREILITNNMKRRKAQQKGVSKDLKNDKHTAISARNGVKKDSMKISENPGDFVGNFKTLDEEENKSKNFIPLAL